MKWMQGPISDQAVFWLAIKVFWWKRLVTFAQWLLAGSIFFNLMNKRHKRALHFKLSKLRDQTRNIQVPPLIRFRTLLAYGVPSVGLFAAALAGVLHLLFTQGGHPIPFWPTWAAFAFLMSLIAVIAGEIIVVVSFLRTTYRGVQRYAPPILAWMLDYRTFDRNVTIGVFAALTAVTVLQIYLS